MAKKIFFFVYLIVAFLLLNKAFDLIELPEFMLGIEKWVIVAAAILIVWSGYSNFLKSSSY